MAASDFSEKTALVMARVSGSGSGNVKTPGCSLPALGPNLRLLQGSEPTTGRGGSPGGALTPLEAEAVGGVPVRFGSDLTGGLSSLGVSFLWTSSCEMQS